jgi:hypothetical protein
LQSIQNNLLFITQGVGSIKNINDLDVYVKNAHCERSIIDLNRWVESEVTDVILKKEVFSPDIRMTLGHW